MTKKWGHKIITQDLTIGLEGFKNYNLTSNSGHTKGWNDNLKGKGLIYCQTFVKLRDQLFVHLRIW